jgi:hypothetical protein
VTTGWDGERGGGMKLRDFVGGPLARLFAWGLVLSLAAGAPAPLVAAPTEPVGLAAPAPALTVLSQPAGAAVYVDGVYQGATPVAVDSVKPGDHRVHVMKDGYLENSRVVAVPSHKGSEVNVQLTPLTGTTRPSYQVDPGHSTSGGGGGGHKKALLIGLGVVAVGAGIYFATKDSNKAPTVSGVTANPTVALQAATAVSFSAAATDPDGDSLTYSWNFGDGASGNGATTSHTYATTGAFAVSVSVSDGKKSATGNANVTVQSLSGSWRGSFVAPGGGSLPFTSTMTQSGTSLSGTYSDPNSSGSLTGSIAAPNLVTMRLSIPGFLPINMTGTVDASLNRISGSATGFTVSGVTFSMTR